MPELPEVEVYRQVASAALGRVIRQVEVLDPLCLAPGTTAEFLADNLPGTTVSAVRRRGKLLALDLRGRGRELTLGVRFGMTGVVIVDGLAAIEQLVYAPVQRNPKWIRFRLVFAGRGELSLQDPRRFGRVVVDPDEALLGPDALTITVRQMRAALAARPGSGPPLKARLLDQGRIAGLGNLVVDELLWRSGLSPLRRVDAVTDEELRRLQRETRATLRLLMRRGGSHTGDLMPERRPGGKCPRDGTPLSRYRVGGRSTWWCSLHQH